MEMITIFKATELLNNNVSTDMTQYAIGLFMYWYECEEESNIKVLQNAKKRSKNHANIISSFLECVRRCEHNENIVKPYNDEELWKFFLKSEYKNVIFSAVRDFINVEKTVRSQIKKECEIDSTRESLKDTEIELLKSSINECKYNLRSKDEKLQKLQNFASNIREALEIL